MPNTQITIAPSVDKGWIVIWITVVDQVWFGSIVIWITIVDQVWFGSIKIEYDLAATRHPLPIFKRKRMAGGGPEPG